MLGPQAAAALRASLDVRPLLVGCAVLSGCYLQAAGGLATSPQLDADRVGGQVAVHALTSTEAAVGVHARTRFTGAASEGGPGVEAVLFLPRESWAYLRVGVTANLLSTEHTSVSPMAEVGIAPPDGVLTFALFGERALATEGRQSHTYLGAMLGVLFETGLGKKKYSPATER